MHARVDDLLLQNDIGLRESRVGRRAVTAVPVGDVVVRAAFQIVANDRRARIERVPDIDHGREDVVVDANQLEGVACRVAVIRDHERDLLTLEAHLVCREHCLDVVGEGRDPGQLERFQILAGEDGAHTWPRERLAGIDGDDSRVSHRRAQDRPVQHPRENDVVRVVALPAHETRVLLALQAAEADRALRSIG